MSQEDYQENQMEKTTEEETQKDWPPNHRFNIGNGLFEIEYLIEDNEVIIRRFDPFAPAEKIKNNENSYDFKFPTHGKNNKEKLLTLINDLNCHPFLLFMFLLKQTIIDYLDSIKE